MVQRVEEPGIPPIGSEPGRVAELFDDVPIGVRWVGGDGTILWANSADCEILGYPAEEYIGRNIIDFQADGGAAEAMLARLEQPGGLEEYPARLRCRDGSIREVRITSSPVFDADGSFLHARWFVRDVTSEATAEERIWLLGEASGLLSSSLDFETTLSSLARLCVPRLADWCAVEIADEHGGSQQLALAHVDPTRVEMARELRRRYPPDRTAPRGVPHVLRTGESEHVEEIPDELIGQVARDAEHERLIRSAGLRSYIIVPIALRGRVLGALTLVQAESKRRYGQRDVELAQELAVRAAHAIEHARLYRAADLARQQAEGAAARLSLIAGLSEALAPSLEPDEALKRLARFVVAHLADYAVAYALEEDGAIRRVGLAHADPGRQQLVEMLIRAGPPNLADPQGAGAVMRTGEPILSTEIAPEELEAGGQNTRHLEVLRQLAPRSSVIVPLSARDRTVGALAVVATDHSGRRYDQADLVLVSLLARRAALLIDNARLYTQAQQATRARDQMLSIVSHDLRSPLNTVVTACELLELDPPEDRRARTRASIRRAANQMNRLLEDLLDVTRIEEGRLTLQREPLDPDTLLREIASLHGPVAEHRGIRLSIRLEQAPLTFAGDRKRLCQAVSNLVDNALKFTPELGEVEVAAAADGQWVHISISDTGPGIPDDEIPHLFDRFWRADHQQHTGVGLGLSIARGIAEAHGGRIEVQSRPGEGTCFTLALPAADAGEGAGQPRQRFVLVVDDDDELRREVIDALQASGHGAAGAAHGGEALDFLASNPPPDLVLLDLTMPVMDGWELFSAMRSDPQLRSIPLAIMTGVDHQQLGPPLAQVAACLKKPFSRAQLLDLIASDR